MNDILYTLLRAKRTVYQLQYILQRAEKNRVPIIVHNIADLNFIYSNFYLKYLDLLLH